jgi:hypothetical protein
MALHSYLYLPCYSIATRQDRVTLEEGGKYCGESEMEHFYKNHRIEISVSLDANTWTASLFIYYSEGSQNILVTFPMNQNFQLNRELIKLDELAQMRIPTSPWKLIYSLRRMSKRTAQVNVANLLDRRSDILK